MSAEKVIVIALQIALFTSVLALGFKATLADVLYLWRRPALLARAFVAMYVVMPVVTVMILALPLPLGLKIGLTLLAISSALTTSGTQMLALGGRPPYVYSLLVTTSLLAVITVPLSLAILTALPLAADASVPPVQVAKVIAKTFLVPLALGAIFGRLWPRIADRIAGPLNAAAGYVLLGTLLGLLVLNSSGVWQKTGVLDYLVIALLTIVALAVGHWLGGPDPGDRTTLAIATAERHTSVAALIAALNFPNRQAMVMIVIYKIVTLLVMIPYTKWCKQQIASRSTGSAAAQQPNPGTQV
jgi:BASS family bile acid:Na+ symporter